MALIAGARVKCENTIDAETTDVVIQPNLCLVNDTAPGRTFGWLKVSSRVGSITKGRRQDKVRS